MIQLKFGLRPIFVSSDSMKEWITAITLFDKTPYR